MHKQRESSAGKLPAWPQLTVARGEPLVWGRRTYVMGIINLSPDSFSGDGLGADLPAVVEQGLRFQAEGADFLDVGAESTRPGATPITPERELGVAAAGFDRPGRAGQHSYQRGYLQIPQWRGNLSPPGPLS